MTLDLEFYPSELSRKQDLGGGNVHKPREAACPWVWQLLTFLTKTIKTPTRHTQLSTQDKESFLKWHFRIFMREITGELENN